MTRLSSPETHSQSAEISNLSFAIYAVLAVLRPKPSQLLGQCPVRLDSGQIVNIYNKTLMNGSVACLSVRSVGDTIAVQRKWKWNDSVSWIVGRELNETSTTSHKTKWVVKAGREAGDESTQEVHVASFPNHPKFSPNPNKTSGGQITHLSLVIKSSDLRLVLVTARCLAGTANRKV